MIKIGITGSLVWVKQLLVRLYLLKRLLFSADKAVQDLYQNKNFKSLIRKRFT